MLSDQFLSWRRRLGVRQTFDLSSVGSWRGVRLPHEFRSNSMCKAEKYRFHRGK